MANIMPACTMGCDHLFELGFVQVDTGGVIRRGSTGPLTADLERALMRVEGRPCAAYSAQAEPYFAWQRTEVASS